MVIKFLANIPDLGLLMAGTFVYICDVTYAWWLDLSLTFMVSIPCYAGPSLQFCQNDTSVTKWTHYKSGHALGIWIWGCSLFYRRELCVSKSAGFNGTKSLQTCGCKRWCPKDVQVYGSAAPVLTYSLQMYITCVTFGANWVEISETYLPYM